MRAVRIELSVGLFGLGYFPAPPRTANRNWTFRLNLNHNWVARVIWPKDTEPNVARFCIFGMRYHYFVLPSSLVQNFMKRDFIYESHWQGKCFGSVVVVFWFVVNRSNWSHQPRQPWLTKVTRCTTFISGQKAQKAETSLGNVCNWQFEKFQVLVSYRQPIRTR